LSSSLKAASGLWVPLPTGSAPGLAFSVQPVVGARPGSGSRGRSRRPAELGSLGPRPPRPQPAGVGAGCTPRGLGGALPLPAAAPPAPAAWLRAGSPPQSGEEEGGESGGVGDRHSLGAQLRLETDGGGGGRRDISPGDGSRDTSPRRPAPTPPRPPAPRLHPGPAGQAGECGWPCPPRAPPPRPAGDPRRAGEEPPPPPPPDRLRVPGKVKGGRGARGRPGCKVPGS
jgi:hypothetical protein